MLIGFSGGWRLLVLRGVAGVLLGFGACTVPGITLDTVALLCSGYALIDGTLALLAAVFLFYVDGPWGVSLVESVIGIMAGLAAFHAMTVEGLIRVMAARSLVTGAALTIAAMRLRRCTAVRWPLALGATASMLFGVIILVSPIAGALGLAMYLSCYGFVFGLLLMLYGHWLRAWVKSDHLGEFVPDVFSERRPPTGVSTRIPKID